MIKSDRRGWIGVQFVEFYKGCLSKFIAFLFLSSAFILKRYYLEMLVAATMGTLLPVNGVINADF